MAALQVALVVAVLCTTVFAQGEVFPTPTDLTVSLEAEPDGDKVHANVEWEITGDDYTRFFKVSWGVIGRNLTEAETSNKTLLIHDLEQNASYTLRVDVYFPVHDGEPVARTSANVSFDVPRTLPRPSEVEVAHLNYSRVLLGWKVESPQGSLVNTSEFRYAVTYQAQGQQPTSIVIKNTTLELKDLTRSTNYTVTIITMMDGWTNSSVRTSRFETREKDWPSAVMQHPTLISNGTEDSATYDFEWEFPETDADYEFHVIICAPQCREIIRAALEKDLQYPLEYYTDYIVTVKTVYYLPLNQNVTRLSNTMKGKSSVGAPGPIEVRNIEQRLNKLLLRWEPPKMTRGPISHYEVKATDAFNAEVENTKRVEATEMEFELPHLTDRKSYNLTLIAVAVDETTGRLFRGAIGKVYQRRLELLDPPAEVRRTACSTDSIDIEITPSSDLEGVFYWIQYNSGLSEWHPETTRKISNLTPHELVSIRVSSCFLDSAELQCCGDLAANLRTWSNSGHPQKVENFTAEVTHNSSIRISWGKPVNTNGLLKGYTVAIIERSNHGALWRNFTLRPSYRTLEIPEIREGTSYNVTIAAFNEDEMTHDRLIGEESLLEVHVPETGGWVGPVIVLIVLAVAAIGAVGFYYYRKNTQARNTPIMTFSFLNNRDNNQNTVLVNE